MIFQRTYMFYPESKKNSVYTKVLSIILFSFLLIVLSGVEANAQKDALMVVSGRTSTTGKSALAGNLGVRTVNTSDEPLEGVEIEVKKNGVTITKITSGKKGKYSFQIPVSTTDSKNDYTVYISKEGMVPKILNINAYVSKEEFAQNSFVRYDFDLDIPMVQTTVKDIVLEKASGKIKWDEVKEHKFTWDQTYAKIVQKEEQKMNANPDQYFKNLAKKKKKEEEDLAKKKTAEEAKLKADLEAKKKADEDVKKLAEQKAKEDAERILNANMDALKKEMKKKRIADSLAEIENRKTLEASSAKLEIKKFVKSVPEENNIQSIYDASGAYSINIAKKSLSAAKEKRNKEKVKNLSMKYETNNVLTSLLDMVDEHDKKMKKQ